MRSRNRAFKWNLFFQGYAFFYVLITGIFLVPLYLKYIPSSDYGNWITISSIIGWIGTVDPGLSGVLLQRISALNQRNSEIGKLIASGLILSLLISVIILCIGLISSSYLTLVIPVSQHDRYLLFSRVFLLAVSGTALMVFSYGVAAINQGLHSSLGTGLIFTFSTLASMLFSILLLEKNFGLYALAIALFAKGFLLLTFNLLYLLIRMRFDNIQFSLSIRSLKNISTLSMYTFWGKLVSGFAVNFEPLLISYFLGPLAVTNYSITKKSSELGLSFLERPSIAIIPSLSSIYAEKKNSRTIEIVITMLKCVLWASGLAFSGVVVVNYIFVSFWVGSQFYAGENINLALSLSAVATLLANSMANTCYALGNIKQNSIVLLIQNISSILLAYWGFIFWGTLGVALAPAISVLVFPLWYYIHTLSIKLNFSRKVLLGLVVEATYAICASVITCLSAFAFLPKSNPFLLPLAIAYCLTLYLFLLFSFSRQFRSMIFLGFSRFRNSGNIIT